MTQRLAALTWRDGPTTANLLMIWQKNEWLPPVLKAFMQGIREDLTIYPTRAKYFNIPPP
jgi:hypothetical protein